jgi:hypothetical protein
VFERRVTPDEALRSVSVAVNGSSHGSRAVLRRRCRRCPSCHRYRPR